jgi:hypothetical protein
MPGCRDSDISVFCCASAGAPGSVNPSIAIAPKQLRHTILFIPDLLRRHGLVDHRMEMH